MNKDLPERPVYIRTQERIVTRKQKVDSRFYSDRVLCPLANWVHNHHGSMQEVARRASAHIGREIPRQHLLRWLNKDPDKRVEPSLGMGLLLIRIIKTIRTEYRNAIACPGTTGKYRVDDLSIKPDDEDLPPLEEGSGTD